MPKVSVIMPVYNTQRYLRECLDSVVNQTLRNIEIICVDDSSTDGSPEILREYQAKDERITILKQEKSNAGAARNLGLSIASGEYLSFLDSDDFFELTMLEHMYACAKNRNADIVVCENDHGIDLVYLYVNSSDEAWLAKRNQYAMDQNISVCRFRDNKELMYSLRSVEKYAPWIRNIYIVSNSSMPAWLNTDHPKLHIISHETIMPADSLPCFNSYVIESYLHRIPGLSEIFLYANDDMFFGNHVSPDFFIKHGILKACFPIDLLYDKPLYELFFTRTGKDAEKRKERSKCLRSASSSRSIKSSHISVNVWTACWRRRLPILN